MGVPKDSQLRNLKQIPYPAPPPPVQSQTDAVDEDAPSIRELVRVINTHMESVDLEVTNNLNATEGAQEQQLLAGQPTEDVLDLQVNDVVHLPPTNPLVWYLRI